MTDDEYGNDDKMSGSTMQTECRLGLELDIIPQIRDFKPIKRLSKSDNQIWIR